ncbi:MAG TPA: gluconeogenesis factor YvcK family protein, partial [bacterium]|nr:gluconeogenesis factor YvcK family protein [bacterium]
MPRLRWLYPGMRLKRWFLLMAFSVLGLAMGFSGLLGRRLHGVHYNPPLIMEFADNLKHLKFADFLLILLCLSLGVYAVRRALFAVLTVLLPDREKEFMNIAYRQARLKRGPRIVCVGGGTGLPNVLYGLKQFTSNLTAVVTVADDGGSSGRLRKDFGTPPPGDIRNCLVALADQQTLLNDLFQYRFKGHGDLKGHSFGNLFITVMGEITGDFGKAVEESSKVLATRGTVMPVTFDSMTLQARFKNGRVVTGESAIPEVKSPINEVMLKEKRIRPNKEVLKAILEADAIVL